MLGAVVGLVGMVAGWLPEVAAVNCLMSRF